MDALGIGVWILPKPNPKKAYVKIPRIARTIPFGYKVDEDDPKWLAPIPEELEALEKAKQYLKQYSLRNVAAWLSKVTGREISHVGLTKRIKNEQSQRQRTAAYRQLAKRYKKALEKAQEFEQRIGTAQDEGYFASDEYSRTRDSFAKLPD
jgi:hypothetical protein